MTADKNDDLGISPHLKFYLFFSGLCVAVLGTLVIIGWYIHSETLIRVTPSFSSMKYNTALCFILSGLGLISLIRHFSKGCAVISFLIALLCGLTILEYMTGLSFDIDQLFFYDYIREGGSIPGRMAPSTAFCFFSFAVSLILLSFSRSRHRFWAAGFLGTVIFAIGLGSAISYLTGMRAAYFFGNIVSMAIHTAMAFMALGSSVILFSKRKENPYLPAIFVFCICFLAAAQAFFVLELRNSQQMESEFSHKSALTVEEIEKTLNENLRTIKAAQAFYASSAEVDRNEFQTFALHLLSDSEGLRALEWVPRVPSQERKFYEEKAREAGFHDFKIKEKTASGGFIEARERAEYYPIYYFEPYEGNEDLLGYDIASDLSRKFALEKSRDHNRLIVSEVGLRGPLHQKVFSVVLPVYKYGKAGKSVKDRRENLQGFVVGLLENDAIVQRSLSQDMLDDVYLEIWDISENEPVLIYPSHAVKNSMVQDSRLSKTKGEEFFYEAVMFVADRKWQVKFEPLKSYLQKKHQTFPYFVFASLLMISLLLTAYIVSIIRRTKVVNDTVRAQTAEIKRNKKLLDDLVGHSPAVIYIKDTEGRYLMVNHHFETLFNVKSSQIIDFTDDAVFPKYLADLFKKNDSEILNQKKVIKVEEIVSQDDGNHVYMSVKFPLYDERNEVYAICGISTDITDEKRAQEALKNSEKRLNLAIEAGNIGLWDWMDIYKDEVWWSQHFHKLLGYEMGEIKPSVSFFREIVHPDYLSKTFELLDEHFAKNVPFDIEYLLKTKKGEYRWFRTQGETLRDKDSHPYRMLGTILDIHERKMIAVKLEMLADDLRNKNDELEIERQRFILASESAGQGVWDWDIKNNTLVWDNKMYELYGVKKSDFPRIYEGWQKALLPEDREFAESELQAALRGEKEFRPCFRILRPDGQIRTIKADAVVLRNEKGQAVRVIGVNADVTEEKELQSKLIQINQELEQFAYIASHDLQEPLRKIIAFGNLLKEKGVSLDQESKDYIERMKKASERMQRLIEDLLTYSRLGRGSQEMKPVNMNEVLSNVLSDMELNIEKRGAKIEKENFPTIMANEIQIQQLFQNLLSNSLKYSKKDVPPRIFIKSKVLDGDVVEFTVEDNGIGFDEKYAERIFVPFQRLHHWNEYEGTGVGLAICKKIVELNKGTIKVKSKEGEGSTFIIQLPIQRGEDAK